MLVANAFLTIRAVVAGAKISLSFREDRNNKQVSTICSSSSPIHVAIVGTYSQWWESMTSWFSNHRKISPGVKIDNSVEIEGKGPLPQNEHIIAPTQSNQII